MGEGRTGSVSFFSTLTLGRSPNLHNPMEKKFLHKREPTTTCLKGTSNLGIKKCWEKSKDGGLESSSLSGCRRQSWTSVPPQGKNAKPQSPSLSRSAPPRPAPPRQWSPSCSWLLQRLGTGLSFPDPAQPVFETHSIISNPVPSPEGQLKVSAHAQPSYEGRGRGWPAAS